jgi:hypothetical protein
MVMTDHSQIYALHQRFEPQRRYHSLGGRFWPELGHSGPWQPHDWAYLQLATRRWQAVPPLLQVGPV